MRFNSKDVKNLHRYVIRRNDDVLYFVESDSIDSVHCIIPINTRNKKDNVRNAACDMIIEYIRKNAPIDEFDQIDFEGKYFRDTINNKRQYIKKNLGFIPFLSKHDVYGENKVDERFFIDYNDMTQKILEGFEIA